MLSRYINRSFKMLSRRAAATFSGGHDHHHDYSVKVNRDAPLIRYKSDPKLACIEGFEDLNYPLQPLDNSDPFPHIKATPFFSFQRFIYNDPWYHDDSHQIYNSAPERGYINGEDPLETRFRYAYVGYASIMMFSIFISIIAIMDPFMTNSQCLIYSEKIARDYAENELIKKNNELNQLKAREAELVEALSK